MKKKLESDLISIAHRILKLKGKEDVNKLHNEVSELYEKLTVLKFAQDNFEDNMPTIGSGTSFFDTMDKAFNNKISDTIEVEDRVYVNVDDVEDDDIFEPVMEKIKDMVAQMPQEANAVDVMVESVIPNKKTSINELEDLVADFQETPVFEPISEANKRQAEVEKKSLNDKLKSGGSLSIGLNDKLAFIKNLFDGKADNYDHVIMQIDTSKSLEEAKTLIQNIVKPEYNYWEGKEELEERFIGIIESKFD